MISKVVSMDIVKYLQEERNLSAEAISTSMGTTISHVEKVINKKEQFTPEEINKYINSSELQFWEFALAAIPLNHLSEKTRNRVLLCKQLSDHIKKKK
jgi:plasmid maintenance system antidote protein VapI